MSANIKISVWIELTLLIVKLELVENVLDHLDGSTLLDDLFDCDRNVLVKSRHVAFCDALPDELFEF